MKKKFMVLLLVCASFFCVFQSKSVKVDAAAISAETMKQKFAELKAKYPENSTWNGSYNNLSWQCMGWAETVCDYLFGENPRNWAPQTNWDNMCVGDHVRINNDTHSIVITNISGNTIYYADCNWGYTNQVHWNKTMTRSELISKATWFKSQPDNWVRTLDNIGHNPEGCFDSCTGGAGVVTLSGWAFDRDDTSAALDIHVYIGGDAGIAGSEGHVIRANKVRSDVNSVTGVGGNHGFSETITTSKRGTQVVNVHAINVGNGENTKLGTKTVTITNPTPPKAATPTITPSNYVGGKKVALSCSTSGAAIYYTTNGSNPTTSSAKYTAPFNVTANTTIKAIAVLSGYTNSDVASSTVNVSSVTAPTIDVSDVNGSKNVTLSCSTSGATIYYTTNGSNPTTSSTKYTAPFNVTASATIKAIAVASGYTNSAVISKEVKVVQFVSSVTLKMSIDISTANGYHNVCSEFTNPVVSTYIAAFYDKNNNLLQTVTKNVDENTDVIEFKVPRIENAASAKIFLWDKMKNMRPLLESKTIRLN